MRGLTGQSLGLGAAVYGQARIKLPPGAIIALYTDGRVETRTRSFDQGISALRAVLDRRPAELESACDTLIASLAERSEDDVTVVLARIPSGTGISPPANQGREFPARCSWRLSGCRAVARPAGSRRGLLAARCPVAAPGP